MSPNKFIAVATILIICFASTALTVPLNQYEDKAITELSTTEKPCGFLCKLNRTKHKLLNSTKTAVDDAKKSIKDIESKIKVFIDDKVKTPVQEIIEKRLKNANRTKSQQVNVVIKVEEEKSTIASGTSKTISELSTVSSIGNLTFGGDLVEVFNFTTRDTESDINDTEPIHGSDHQVDFAIDNIKTIMQTERDIPGETVERPGASSTGEKMKPLPGQHYPGCDCNGNSDVIVQSTDSSSSVPLDAEIFDSATDYNNILVEQQGATEEVAVTDNLLPAINTTDSKSYLSILNDLLSKFTTGVTVHNDSTEPSVPVTDELLTDTVHSTPIRRDATAGIELGFNAADNMSPQQPSDSVSVVNNVQSGYSLADASITSPVPNVVASENVIDKEASNTSPDNAVFPEEQPPNRPDGNGDVSSGTENYVFSNKENVGISNSNTPFYNGVQQHSTNYDDNGPVQPWHFGEFNMYYSKLGFEGNNRSQIANLPSDFDGFNAYRNGAQNAKSNDRYGSFPLPSHLRGYGSYYNGAHGIVEDGRIGYFPSYFNGLGNANVDKVNNVPFHVGGSDVYRNRNHHTATNGKINNLPSYMSGFNNYQNGADRIASNAEVGGLPSYY